MNDSLVFAVLLMLLTSSTACSPSSPRAGPERVPAPVADQPRDRRVPAASYQVTELLNYCAQHHRRGVIHLEGQIVDVSGVVWSIRYGGTDDYISLGTTTGGLVLAHLREDQPVLRVGQLAKVRGRFHLTLSTLDGAPLPGVQDATVWVLDPP